MRRERRPSFFLRGLLLFVLGGLVGANATYFVMTRGDARAPQASPTPTQGEGDRIETPLPISGASPSQAPVLPPPTVRATGSGPMPTASVAPASAGDAPW